MNLNEQTTYSMRQICNNCGDDREVKITKGQTREMFEKTNVCPVCECATLTIKPITRFRGSL